MNLFLIKKKQQHYLKIKLINYLEKFMITSNLKEIILSQSQICLPGQD